MYLKHINLLNFKNLKQCELDLTSGINCFVGKNGAGKTNLLDAVFYMSFCKSYFNSIDSQLIHHDEDFFVIQGSYVRGDQDDQIYAGLKRNQKKQFKRNKKEYTRLSDHIGLLPLVMISPGDERLITEGSELRRKYIDSVVSQFDKPYLDLIIRYNRIVNQRNVLLKSARGNIKLIESQLDVWDEQLAITGEQIFNKRETFIKELEPVFQKYYCFISGGHEQVSIIYHSHHQKGKLTEQLLKRRAKDLVLGYTSKGIHRDDLELLLNGYAVKKDGSQGQKKTFFIALKLAQFEFLKDFFGFSPILLLDDLFDKLDDERVSSLIELAGRDTFQQIFITDTQRKRLHDIVKQTGKEHRFFQVDNGEINFEI
ncbi:DNA replication/repair protein RecF [Alkalitalea saponilacus]|uniref:DNA replication and repair protein RecF n=1 Tax=Alkalitalea saponilacus TaxID=889453 RepID=A0A1T5D7H4_9BACT|nr:DNA replication and repair protein RecF [Alkalitalea saponilacus]ASB50609.1 DNA replication and repair protein RecF [Alkalitalea saponilacus]SKB67625.1 DNA replication and repair protein RecF [Alkalitalea saponilacus]